MSDWKFQDLHLSHQDIYKQYRELFENDNIDEAHKLIIPDDNTQPNYDKYAIQGDGLNEAIDLANSIQDYWFMDVINYLSQQQEIFNQLVDNLQITPVEWVSGTIYKQNQFVTHENITYLCITETTDTTPITDLNYWIPFIIQGNKGLNSFGIMWRGAWQANNRYNKNACVFVETSLQEIEIYVSNTNVTDIVTSPVTNSQWTKVLTIQRNRMPYTATEPVSHSYPYDWAYLQGESDTAQLVNVINDGTRELSIASIVTNINLDCSTLMNKTQSTMRMGEGLQAFYNYYNL